MYVPRVVMMKATKHNDVTEKADIQIQGLGQDSIWITETMGYLYNQQGHIQLPGYQVHLDFSILTLQSRSILHFISAQLGKLGEQEVNGVSRV